MGHAALGYIAFGDYGRARFLFEQALSDNPGLPGWFYFVPVLSENRIVLQLVLKEWATCGWSALMRADA